MGMALFIQKYVIRLQISTGQDALREGWNLYMSARVTCG